MSKRLFVVAVFILFFVSHPLLANQNKEDEALKAANAWLSVVDAGNYTESWDKTSQAFKSAVSESKWVNTLTSFRKSLGDVLSRNMVALKYTTALPGAPDGEYVVVQYQTTFKNKASSIETVTPSLEKDGVWRVSGYFIK